MKPKPYCYIVIFHEENSTNDYTPLILVEKGKNPYSSNSTLLLDSDMESVLPVIEYIMQLPRGDLDLLDINEYMLNLCNEMPHFIILCSDSIFNDNSTFGQSILSQADCIFLCTSVNGFEVQSKPFLGVYSQNEIGSTLLKKQWNTAFDNLQDCQFDVLPYEPIYISGIQLKSLPFLFLARQFYNTTEMLKTIYTISENEIENQVNKFLYYLIVKNKSYLSLNNTYYNKAEDKSTYSTNAIQLLEDNLDKKMQEVAKSTNINVVITFPGISKRIRTTMALPSSFSDSEYRAVRIMGLHRAIATNSALIEIKSTNDKIYQLVDNLEMQIKSGTNNPHIWKLLSDVGKEIDNLLSIEQKKLLLQAPSICAFTEFPLGLAILPGQEVPLSVSHQIYYKPIVPLSRQLTIELTEIKSIQLYKSCRILFVECIPDNDDNKIVHEWSEELSSQISEMSKKCSISKYYHEEAYSVVELKTVLNRYPKGSIEILILSAHGFYDTNRNISGLCIGENDRWMADDDDIFVPPIVLLSACHVSPRGRNAVNACDLLMRSGASTIISTLIPINVIKNTLLYSRLFTYIFDSIMGTGQVKHRTLADAWTHVVATNAVNEILENSTQLKEWYISKNKRGQYRIVDFKLHRSAGRLRSTNIYSDTITILKEMLAEEGINGKYDSILIPEQCFPESFFYQMVGYPENVLLSNDMEDNQDHYSNLHQ